jgi:hypothetical protein
VKAPQFTLMNGLSFRRLRSDGTADELLARAGLAADEHGRVGLRDGAI